MTTLLNNGRKTRDDMGYLGYGFGAKCMGDLGVDKEGEQVGQRRYEPSR